MTASEKNSHIKIFITCWFQRPCIFSLCWHLIKRTLLTEIAPFFSIFENTWKSGGEFPQRMDLQLYPHMINITQGGLCTGSSMSNYGPTVSDWEQTRCQRLPVGTALTRHTNDFTWARGGDVIGTQISWRRAHSWLSKKSGSRYSTSSWQQPPRNAVNILDLASMKPNREAFHVFKVNPRLPNT